MLKKLTYHIMGKNNCMWWCLIVIVLVALCCFMWWKLNIHVSLNPPEHQEFNITVSQDGGGDFRTVSEAIKAAPSNGATPFYIRVCAGIYHEVVVVANDKTNLVLVGDGADVTKITASRHSPQYTTSESATFSVHGDGFMAKDITFENDAGDKNGQAVALLCSANQTTFYKCSFIGYHDTLYAKQGTQFYRECDIYGRVDFIFGSALAVFQKCNLYARVSTSKDVMYTAQGRRSLDQKSGFTIQGCNITVVPNGGSTMTGFLGRPWFPYSTVMVMESYLDSVVNARGWEEWSSTPATNANYLEFENWGPGADTSGRVQWPGFKVVEDPNEALLYTVSELIQGDDWIPRTGVPYKSRFMSDYLVKELVSTP